MAVPSVPVPLQSIIAIVATTAVQICVHAGGFI